MLPRVPEVEEIMLEADVGRTDAGRFRIYYDDLPPSKRGDWRDEAKRFFRHLKGTA